jgi:microcystin-dependent protein
MSTPFLAEIKMVTFNFAPKGWAVCNGQLLAINQNAAIFSLLGTTYGGNGTQTFQLPNLQGCSPLHIGVAYPLGQFGGEENHTVDIEEMPAHAHQANGVGALATSGSAAGNSWAKSASNPYSATSNGAMSAAGLSQQGGSQPHNNMPPYLVLNFVIALQGIYPSRN